MVKAKTPRRFAFIATGLLVVGVSLVASLMLLWAPAQAQQPPTPTLPAANSITFSGPVDSVGPRFIVVNGLLVNLDGAAVPLTGFEVGATVTVFGTLTNNVIQAARVELGDVTGASGQFLTMTPLPFPTSTPLALNLRGSGAGGDDDRPRRVIIQGPVREISPTSIRVFNLDVAFDPNIVNVNNIQVGDNVRIEGDFVVVNNVFTVVAVNATVINPPLRRGDSDISQRDSVSGRTAPQAPAPPPPPPAPAPRGSNGDSGRGSVSAASGRSS